MKNMSNNFLQSKQTLKSSCPAVFLNTFGFPNGILSDVNYILNSVISLAVFLQLKTSITCQHFSSFNHDCTLMICLIEFFPIILKIIFLDIMLLNILIHWLHLENKQHKFRQFFKKFSVKFLVRSFCKKKKTFLGNSPPGDNFPFGGLGDMCITS